MRPNHRYPPSELLHIKTKESRINEHKKLKKKLKLKLNEQFTFST